MYDDHMRELMERLTFVQAGESLNHRMISWLYKVHVDFHTDRIDTFAHSLVDEIGLEFCIASVLIALPHQQEIVGSGGEMEGPPQHLLVDAQRERACQRIRLLMPLAYDRKCDQALEERWDATDFSNWWLPKIFSDPGAGGISFARDFMHKLWFCDDDSFLKSWPYWKLHHPYGGLSTILE